MSRPAALSADEVPVRVDNLHPVKINVSAAILTGYFDYSNLGTIAILAIPNAADDAHHTGILAAGGQRADLFTNGRLAGPDPGELCVGSCPLTRQVFLSFGHDGALCIYLGAIVVGPTAGGRILDLADTLALLIPD